MLHGNTIKNKSRTEERKLQIAVVYQANVVVLKFFEKIIYTQWLLAQTWAAPVPKWKSI